MRNYDEFIKVAKTIEHDEYGFPKKRLGKGYVVSRAIGHGAFGAAVGALPAPLIGPFAAPISVATAYMMGREGAKNANKVRVSSYLNSEERKKIYDAREKYKKALSDIDKRLDPVTDKRMVMEDNLSIDYDNPPPQYRRLTAQEDKLLREKGSILTRIHNIEQEALNNARKRMK